MTKNSSLNYTRMPPSGAWRAVRR